MTLYNWVPLGYLPSYSTRLHVFVVYRCVIWLSLILTREMPMTLYNWVPLGYLPSIQPDIKSLSETGVSFGSV